jgi:hypothetical protein
MSLQSIDAKRGMTGSKSCPTKAFAGHVFLVENARWMTDNAEDKQKVKDTTSAVMQQAHKSGPLVDGTRIILARAR